jgi:hypothetical protein
MNNKMFIINIIIVADNTHSNRNNIHIQRATENRGNVTNTTYISGTRPQDTIIHVNTFMKKVNVQFYGILCMSFYVLAL